jgi:hypothetical protein
MRQLAHVDLWRAEYVVWSSSRTVSGMWVMNGMFRRLPRTAGSRELGAAVERALSASVEGVPQPPLRDAPSPFQPVLEALRLPSYARYLSGTRSTMVERDSTEVVVTPQRNGGGRGGFVPITQAAVRLAAPETTELGAAVAAAVARST